MEKAAGRCKESARRPRGCDVKASSFEITNSSPLFKSLYMVPYILAYDFMVRSAEFERRIGQVKRRILNPYF
jgi:hypothetical protein